MHVMVATDGSLDPERTAELVKRLAGDGETTVLTVVEVPRRLLDDMRAAWGEHPQSKLQEVTVEYRDDQPDSPPPTQWIGDDAAIERYVNDQVSANTAGLAETLARAGVAAKVVGYESENTERAILDAVAELGVDVLCIGTHGLGRFEGLLGSISTKLARRAPCSVVLVR